MTSEDQEGAGGRADADGRVEGLVGLAAGIAALAAGLLAVAPSLGYQDSGELVAAAYQLGVPHPTGFPPVMLLAKLWTLLPLGTIAMRASLLSATSAALAVGLVAALATRLGRSLGAARPAAAVAGLTAAALLACSQTMIVAATGLEAYAPSLALLVGMLLLALPRRGAPAPRSVALLGLLFGAGATTHVIVRLSGLLPLGSALLGTKLRRRALVALSLAALAGTLVVLYLPLASLRDPPMDWGDPETLGRLWDHLTAGRIRRSFEGRMLNAAWIGLDASTLWSLLEGDLGLAALGLAMVGLGAAAKGRPKAAALLGLVAAADGAYDVLVNPMGLADRQVGLPLEAALAALAGAGLSAVVTLAPRRAHLATALPVAALALGAPLAGATHAVGPGQGPPSLVATAASPPARATILCASDTLCGGLAWAQYVEGDRPDLVVLPRQHLWDPATLEARVGRHAPELALPPGRGLGLEEALELLETRGPVYWERGGDEAELRRERGPHPLSLAAPPPLSLVAGPYRPAEEAAEEARRALALWFGAEGPRDRDGRLVAATTLESIATTASEWGDLDAAAALLQASLAFERRPSALLNLSALEVSAGRERDAVAWAEAAVVEDPGSVRALVALGRLHLAADRDAEALPAFERARALCPTRCGEPLEGLGILAARRDDLGEAEALLREALRRDPTLEDAAANLRVLERLRGTER